MRQLVAYKLHAHKKQAGVVVAVLRGFLNIAAVLQEKTGHGVNDAHAVRAGQSQDVNVIHKL